MNPFDYVGVSDADDALRQKQRAGSRFLAGGTTQIDLMKCDVEQPAALIDINSLAEMREIAFTADTLRIGALARMSEVENHPECRLKAPAIYDSLWQAASPQLRNMASIGGNLLQRTRCVYFRDPHTFSACNKRQPGSGCAARDGVHGNHAILGTSESCIAVYPGDLAVALTAFEAVVVVRNAAQRERRIPIDEFYLLPGDTPHLEHDLAPDEMIVAVELPLTPALHQSHYLKVRDRSSYEFAAASAAVGIELDGDHIRDLRVAVGGVATKPWRARHVEGALRGQPFSEQTLRRAAELVVQDAELLPQNQHKKLLAPRAIARALMKAGGMA
ncbi:FAD binding domain-containing protein [Pantoea sp. RRHST58]|uniref:FAD binding domain-containing protein n=1 Tax=Pantoea sp. RRHST58 TaxID=3425183 RepID=UPI003D9FB9D2